MIVNNKKIIFTDHLLMRLKIRNIRKKYIYEVFQKGKKINRGQGKASVITAKLKNDRKLTVVYEDKIKVIVVITAYWED